MAAAAGARDRPRGHLPAQPVRLGWGVNRRGRSEDRDHRATGAVAPNSANELDCNGWSHKYQAVAAEAGALCTDPIKILNGKATRFADNGWYVGHDEPSVKFISSQPGSGNTMTYAMKLSRDPKAAPTRERQRHRLRAAVPRALVRAADLRPEVLPAEPVQAGQRHQLRPDQRPERRRLGVHGTAVLPAGLHPALDRRRELQRDEVVRGA